MDDMNMNNRNNIPTADDDSLGLDNEALLSRRRKPQSVGQAGAASQPKPTANQRSVSPQRPAAQKTTAQNACAPRQRPATVQRSSPATQAPAEKPRPVARPVRPAGSTPRTAQAVVPAAPKTVTEKKAPEAPVPKAPQTPPAYASRRAYTQSQTGNKTSKQTSQSSPASDKMSGSPRTGADMMVSIVKGIVYMVLVLVVSVTISIFAIRVGNDIFAFVKSDEQLEVTIPENATTADVADILADNGIIHYPGIFKMYASLKHEKGDYLAGNYTVSPSMSYDTLRASFKEKVETGTCWITIPEGYTTDEIIDLMVENGIGKRNNYIDVINNYEFDYWFVKELDENGYSEDRAYRLDGYLFPDSYEFYKASSEVTVINKLLARFNEVFVQDFKTRADQIGYTVDQVLQIASLIEKEAGGAADFMYVSSVFHNRLKDPYNFPKLESDATVVYAIQIATGERPKEITPEDLKFESPYNTYLNNGLIPGPITNPSASAIRYALYPTDTNYKYFVSADNGTTFYASSLYEHQLNIEKVRAMNAEQQ